VDEFYRAPLKLLSNHCDEQLFDGWWLTTPELRGEKDE